MTSSVFPPSDFDQIVESFVQRRRRGDRPSIDEYVARYPQFAGDILSLFPTLEVVEQAGTSASSKTRNADPVGIPSREAPRQIGDYRIVRELGRGGMGIVYEAVQESLARQVALKLFPWPVGTRAILEERFRREAQAAARMHHSNIAPVFGVGEADGTLFYTMQYIQGASLDVVLDNVRSQRDPDARARREPSAIISAVTRGLFSGAIGGVHKPGMSSSSVTTPGRRGSEDAPEPRRFQQYLRNVAGIGIQVAGALGYAHDHGIIHRDIKPSNLMIDHSGVVWVMDFGLAKADGSDALTEAGDVLGTLRYMSPEQLAGGAESRSDIYSLGMTLYELATLRPAFDDPVKTRLMDRIRSANPMRPRSLEPRIPRDLETILLKMIAADPRDRYRTAEAVAEDLRAFVADRPISARRASLLEQAVRWFRRNPVLAGLTTSIALLLLLAVVASLFTASVLRQQRNEAYMAQESARRQLWQAKINEAKSVTLSRHPGQRAQGLHLVQEALGIVDYEHLSDDERVDVRSVAASALLLDDMNTLKSWQPQEAHADGWEQTFDFDQQIKTYAIRHADGGVSLRDVADDHELQQFLTLGPAPIVRLSASGKRLAIIDRFSIFELLEIWDVGRRPAQRLYEALGKFGNFVAFSADDRRVAVYETRVGPRIVDLESRTRLSYSSPGTYLWRPLAFDPLGERIAYSDGMAVRVSDARTNRELARIKFGSTVNSIAWHPSGQTIAVGLGSHFICLVDVESQQLLTDFVGHVSQGIAVQFNHRGDRLISNDWSNRMRIWDVGSRRELLSFPSQGRTFCISADDTTIATQTERADGRLRLVRLIPAAELGTIRLPSGYRLDWRGVVLSPVDRIACGHVPHRDPMQRGLGIVSLNDAVNFSSTAHPAYTPTTFLADGSLLSQGESSVYHWPRSLDQAGNTISFGPPRLLYDRAPGGMVASSPDGALLAIPLGTREIVLIRRDQPAELLNVDLPYIRSVAVSPDGKLVAAASSRDSSRGPNVCIIDATTRKVVARVSASQKSRLAFSPDGKWLSARLESAISQCQLWRVGEWDTIQKLDALEINFDRSGQRAAASNTNGTIRIFDPHTSSDLLRLVFPDEESVFARGFSSTRAEESVLLVGSDRHESGRLVDLKVIHQQLAMLGLGRVAPSTLERPADNDPGVDPRVVWIRTAQSATASQGP